MSNGAGDDTLVAFARRARREVAAGEALVVAVGDRRVALAPEVAADVLAALDAGALGVRSAPPGAGSGDRASGLPAAGAGRGSAGPGGLGGSSGAAGPGGSGGPGASSRSGGAAAGSARPGGPPRVTLGGPAVDGPAGSGGPTGTAATGAADPDPAGGEPPAELTTGQAADLLGVSRRTVVQLIERGDLKASRVGTRRRLDAAEVATHRERARSMRSATLRDVIAASRDLDLYR